MESWPRTRSDSRQSRWPRRRQLLFTAVALAHHGTTAFDRRSPIVVSGVVHEFRWTSPHAWIVVDVPADRQGARVGSRSSGPSRAPPLRRWCAMAGRAVPCGPATTSAWLAAPRRDGTRSGEFRRVTLTDSGKVLQTRRASDGAAMSIVYSTDWAASARAAGGPWRAASARPRRDSRCSPRVERCGCCARSRDAAARWCR